MWIVASAVTVLLGIAALAATADTTSRHALNAQLERAAVPAQVDGYAGLPRHAYVVGHR